LGDGNEGAALALYGTARTIAEDRGFATLLVAVLTNMANLLETSDDAAVLDRAEAARIRATLIGCARSGLGRELQDTCAICLEKLNPLDPTEGEAGAILVPECLHMLHNACFRKCASAECPSCRRTMHMSVPSSAAPTPTPAPASPPAPSRTVASSGGSGRGNGSVSHSNGSVSHSNGSVSHSNGSASHSNGSVSHSNGSVSHSNGSASHSNGERHSERGGRDDTRNTAVPGSTTLESHSQFGLE
jgi:hypothetical protein